jgi:hypothetical protein
MTTRANRDRITTALPHAAAYFTGRHKPHHVFPWFLMLATGVSNEDSEEAFLNKHPIYDEEGDVIEFNHELSSKIRAAIELHINQSPLYSEAEKVQARKKLQPEKWNDGFMRNFRHCRYFWFICEGDKQRMIDEYGEQVDLPVSDERSWFYLAITARCDGYCSFNSMKSYTSRFDYAQHKDRREQSGKDFLTLKKLNEEHKVKLRADKKREDAEELAEAEARDAEARRLAALAAEQDQDGKPKPDGEEEDPPSGEEDPPDPSPATHAATLTPMTPDEVKRGCSVELCDPRVSPHLQVQLAKDANAILYHHPSGMRFSVQDFPEAAVPDPGKSPIASRWTRPPAASHPPFSYRVRMARDLH